MKIKLYESLLYPYFFLSRSLYGNFENDITYAVNISVLARMPPVLAYDNVILTNKSSDHQSKPIVY